MSGSMAGIARRRALITALLGAAVGCVLLATLLIGVSGGASGPATGAATLVPADALVFAHVSTDRDRPEVRRALALVSRLPSSALLGPALQARLASLTGGGATLEINSWLGREAAFAQLPSGGLAVLDVRAPAGARRALSAAGAAPAGAYRRTPLLRFPAGGEAAFVSHYVVLGAAVAVQGAIDAAARTAPSLQTASAYRRAARGEPTARVLDVYISALGVRRFLLGGHGIRGAIGALLSQPTLLGATVSLVPWPGGARIQIHSAFDPAIDGLSGVASRPFTPTLQKLLPSGSSLMFDLVGLDRAAPSLLAAGTAAGIGTTIGPLFTRLGAALSAEGVNVPQVLSILHGESALALVPNGQSQPSLALLARPRDANAARVTLANLEMPLAHLFESASGAATQAPLLGDVQVGAATVHQLALAPGLQLDYTVSRGLVIAGTSLRAVTMILQHTRALADDPGYRSALPAHPQKVTSLLFLDFNQLLNLVESTGWTRSASYRAFRADLDTVRAVGLQSTSGEADSTAELFLQIP